MLILFDSLNIWLVMQWLMQILSEKVTSLVIINVLSFMAYCITDVIS